MIGQVRRAWGEGLLLPSVLVAVGLFQGTNMIHSPAPFMDEGTYVSQACGVQVKGVRAPYTYRYDHPPLGWLTIAFWTVLRGVAGHATFSIDAARELMLVAGLASTALVYVLGRRLGLR